MKKEKKANSPICIFDSGVGGLTIAKALMDMLPNETIIYFGDTAHLPYGNKSTQTIQGYAKRIVDFLLKRDVKLILIACGSVSAVAYEILLEYLGEKVLLAGAVDPIVKFLNKNYATRRVGLIATKLTINSKEYHKRLFKLGCNIDLCALETPLLVPIIEEGFFAHKLMDLALHEYLSHPVLQGVEALVLGCTHYPLVKNKIADFYSRKVNIIDPSTIIATEVAALLQDRNLLSEKHYGRDFYVSDYTNCFANVARAFFGEELQIKVVALDA